MTFVAKVSDVPAGGKKLFEVNGKEILLINHKGTIHAVESECPHQGAPMATVSMVKEDYISCQRHGYRFKLNDGTCKEHPEFTLKVYPVRIENDEVLVDLA